MPGDMNDWNVMAFSPLFQSMIACAFLSPITYTLNGVERALPHFFRDGIYPKNAVFIDTSRGDEEKEKVFASRQEGRR